MMPTFKNRGLFGTAVSLLAASALWNCSSDASHDNSSSVVEDTHSNVILQLDYNTPPLLDSLVLDCYGADTLHLVHEANDGTFSMELFPSDHWNFKAKLYANGALMQEGELETKLTAGTTANLEIQMHAIVGFVYVEIPFGLSNAAGIKSGVMTLSSGDSTYVIPMVVESNVGYFKSDMLPLGKTYNVAITLRDESDKEIYSLKDSFLLSEDSSTPELSLNSLRAELSLAIKAAEEKNMNLTVTLPATRRAPKADELLITEYFSAPESKDSSQFEFVEIYNGSLDTLILENCTLDIASGNSNKSFPLTVGEILPAELLVFGTTNSEKTPEEYIHTEGWLDLGNSKGGIALTCNDILMDELYYASEPDSAHPNVVPALGSSKYGSSGQLKIDRWESRKDSTAWCLASPTPGKHSSCN